MNLEKWDGRGNKELIQIPSVGDLKYDRFKQNVKQDNYIEQTLKALSCNIDDNYHPSSYVVILQRIMKMNLYLLLVILV